MANAVFADNARKNNGKEVNSIMITDRDEIQDRIPILDGLLDKWNHTIKYKNIKLNYFILVYNIICKMAEEVKVSKTVLLGEVSVGKTCIINRFVNNSFDLKELSSSSASYVTRTIKFDDIDEEIRFEIWDTVGQEKYRALTKIFYKDAGAAILVYDITRKESFEEIQKYWINQIKEFAPKNISK